MNNILFKTNSRSRFNLIEKNAPHSLELFGWRFHGPKASQTTTNIFINNVKVIVV